MASFVPNYHSGRSIADQWRQHLQTREYLGDVKSQVDRSISAYNARANSLEKAVGNLGREIAFSIESSANTQIEAAGENAAAIVGAIEDVSELVFLAAKAQIEAGRQNTAAITGAIDQGVSRMDARLLQLARVLDDRLDLLADQLNVGHLLSKNIAELLRVPDFQKERIYYLEQGLKHYQNASIDPVLMDDAFRNLLKAEEREPTDYVAAHRLGMIHLNSPDHCDLEKAKSYFLRAARYAAVDSDPKAVRVAQVLTGNITADLGEQIPNTIGVRSLAIDALLNAAEVCYIQESYGEALETTKRALALDQQNTLAQFKAAKYLIRCERAGEAAQTLETVIASDRTFAVMTADDIDLRVSPEIIKLLLHLREDAAERLRSALKDIEASFALLPDAAAEFAPALGSMRRSLRKGDYLSLLSGLDTAAKLGSHLDQSCQAILDLSNAAKSVGPAAASALEEVKKLVTLPDSSKSVRTILSKLPQRSTSWTLTLREAARIKKGGTPTFSPTDESFAHPTMEGIILRSASDGAIIRVFESSKDAGNPVFSPDGRFVASVIGKKNAMIWDCSSGKLLDRFPSANENASLSSSLRFSPDSNFLLVEESDYATNYSSLHIYSVDDRRKVWGRTFSFSAATWTFWPHGQQLLLSTDNSIAAIDLFSGEKNGRITDLLSQMPEGAKWLSFSPNGNYVCFTTMYWKNYVLYHTFNLADARTFKTLRTLVSNDSQLLAWSGGSSYITAITSDKTDIFSVATGSYLPIQLPGSRSHVVDFVPASSAIRVHNWDQKKTSFIRAQDGKVMQELDGYSTFSFDLTGTILACTKGEYPYFDVDFFDVKRSNNLDIKAIIALHSLEAVYRENPVADEASKKQAESLVMQEASKKEAESLLHQAEQLIREEDKKWFRGDYSKPIALLKRAADLGNEAARKRLQQLNSKNKA